MKNHPSSTDLFYQEMPPATPPAIGNLPTVALSIRQPWAWLILHAGKDIENRSWHTRFRGKVLIHAARGFGAAEREDIRRVEEEFRIKIPSNLELGGIVGMVEIVDCVDRSDSPWFCGPFGFKLINPIPLPFRSYRGSLGFFPVKP